MKNQIKFACPLDCFDACALIATVENGRVLNIKGDPDHPLTRGRICPKGKKHLTRLYHPQRLTRPLKRVHGRLLPVPWDEILEEMTQRLQTVKNRYGSTAVLHHTCDGYGGLIKSVDRLFFDLFGGVTHHRGSLCWGAGMAAQKYDFGDVRGHAPEDIVNARMIILWGRNPLTTNVHMVPYLRQAQNAGATIVLIDPIRSASARLSDVHLCIKPSTDGALALGMANVIISEELLDRRFIADRTLGFNRFKSYIASFTPAHTAMLTGITADKIVWLARAYAKNKPAAIILGYGLQRYRNGGNNIRCIDALGALSGNIGRRGGGVNYANRSIVKYLDKAFLQPQVPGARKRTYAIGRLGEFLGRAHDPPVRLICVTKANPLVQCPNLSRTLTAFKKVDYKIVIDMFMTDTARHADVVLPCTSVLEEEDIVFSSMYSPYLNYSAKVLEAPSGVMSEFDLFRRLAQKLVMTDYPDLDRPAFLEAACKPLLKTFRLTMADLKKGYFKIPNRDIPWADESFATPSGKYEFYAEKARADGNSPLPAYIEPSTGRALYGLRLITPHTSLSMHSQHMASAEGLPEACLNGQTLKRQGLESGMRATVASETGGLTVSLRRNDDVGDNLVMIYQGGWHKNGAVNFLVPDNLSDMGEQATYYDCFCRIIPA